MSSDPANIGGTPVGILFLYIENPLGRERSTQQVSAGRVNNAFRLPGRSRRVQNKKRMLGVQFFRWTYAGLPRDDLVPPMVASALHGDILTRAAKNNHMFNCR